MDLSLSLTLLIRQRMLDLHLCFEEEILWAHFVTVVERCQQNTPRRHTPI